MLKGLLGSIAITALLANAPASAQPASPLLECTDASITKASAEVDTMPAGEKKTTAMKEMDIAKEMMAKKDMEGCKTHMNNAVIIAVSK